MSDSWEACRLQAEHCIEAFRQQRLDEASLQRLRELLEAARPKRQSLLYLQVATTGVDSQVIGMSLVAEGRVQEVPADPGQWSYQTVLQAMADGWRVVKFPELALLLQEGETVGLGCEFILEKWT